MLLCGIAYLLILIAVVNSTDVLKLNDENFVSLLAEKQLVLVSFRTAKCHECDTLEPEFMKAAAILKDHDPPVTFAEVDCYHEGKETCKKHSISHYPVMKIFRQGAKAFDYNGPQDSDGLVQYVREKMPLISKELMSVDDVEAFLDRYQYSVIGFFKRRDSVIFERYEMFASTLNEHFQFAHTFNEDVLEHYGYRNTFLAFRLPRLQTKLEPDRIEYSGIYTPLKMRDWLLANMFGSVGYRTKKTASFFSNPLVVVYHDFDYVKNAKATNYWRNRILKVAQTFGDFNVTFAMSNIHDFEQELSELGIAADATQPTVIGRSTDEQFFVMNEHFSVEALEAFARRLLNGTLTHKDKPQQRRFSGDDISSKPKSEL